MAHTIRSQPHGTDLMGSNDGDNVITITLTEVADDDLTPNGIIVDQWFWLAAQMRPSPVFPTYMLVLRSRGRHGLFRRRTLAK
jgi:hypothetical protein